MILVPLNIAGPDLFIVLAIAILLFGGSRLAGVGKSAGQAIREFKEETDQISHEHRGPAVTTTTTTVAPATTTTVVEKETEGGSTAARP